ncbi:MAG: DUF2062 domain-containing protein [Paracoccaceae bacterium]
MPLWPRLREALSPRKGWRRGFEYLGRRMQRLPDTPHRIALGFACGVLTSFTPFFGFHFILAATVAFALRGNVLASAIGTFFGNPVTFPFIAATAMTIGQAVTGLEIKEPAQGFGFGWLWQNLDAIFVPYLVGGLVPGLAAATATYFLLRPVVAAYQDRRRMTLMARAKERLRRSAAARRRKAEEAREARRAAEDPTG